MSLCETERIILPVPQSVDRIRFLVKNISNVEIDRISLVDYMARRLSDLKQRNSDITPRMYASTITDNILLSDTFVRDISTYQSTPIWKDSYFEIIDIAIEFFNTVGDLAYCDFTQVIGDSIIYQSSRVNIS